ncbi:MAG: dephospho-CoA kinase [Bacteroidia bacterium]|nr:dephospho-CoA kinase [Bacteroidia bacterium]
MKKTLEIGITGGIGSGKTHVTKVFLALGVPIYYADDRAKWLMNNNRKIISGVKELFGKKAYTKLGLDRAYLSNKIFKDNELLTALNQVVHPAVFSDYKNWVNDQQRPYILKEAALLFESSSYKKLDAIITVDAPLETRIKRAMKRDNKLKAEIESRIKNQLSNSIKVKAADFVIINDGDTPLLPQILLLHQLWS